MAKKQRNMQKKPKPVNTIPKLQERPPRALNSPDNKINQYTCQTCEKTITTVQQGDAKYGTTPMRLACRATDACAGVMISSMYRVSQNLDPEFEWYAPDTLPKDPELRYHVEMGGLLLRTVEKE